ncbi:MAG TPA: N-acetyl-D-Glu racemase DgcA [Xanthobacteraceae bacterium]|nr:N-acetyl-D-Glu racemase DgcA [Xanthobacteraceae bacterium]
MPRLSVRTERWPISGSFIISRGAKTEATVVIAEIRDGDLMGHGECVPYARYGETPEGVVAAIEALKGDVAEGLQCDSLQKRMQPGAARNALDCALWDIAAKRARKRAWELAGLPAPQPVITAYTISLDTPEKMAADASAANYPLLKLKLGGDGDPERVAKVRAARPDARLIVDANEGWRAGNLEENFAACAAANVELIEQPLPAAGDDVLAKIVRPVPVCADESLHDRASLAALHGKYDAVNIKLDKTGGLTEALALADEAERAGFTLMLGSMVSTSLGVAPALLLTERAKFVDLDGPLLLAKDRSPGLRYKSARVFPPAPELWG